MRVSPVITGYSMYAEGLRLLTRSTNIHTSIKERVKSHIKLADFTPLPQPFRRSGIISLRMLAVPSLDTLPLAERPMLQILSRAMTLVLGVVEVILVQRGAVGVLLVASKELVGQVFDGGRALVEVECGAFGGG